MDLLKYNVEKDELEVSEDLINGDSEIIKEIASNVKGWAGLWLRVDGKGETKSLSFDNMQDRSIKGTTDWTKYVIILDVPDNSSTLNFGALLSGTGKIWFDNITFEEAPANTKSTSEKRKLDRPTNTNFDN